MTNATIKVGDRVRIKAGVPYTQAMQGHIFTVVKVSPRFRFSVKIANEQTHREGLTFEPHNLEMVA